MANNTISVPNHFITMPRLSHVHIHSVNHDSSMGGVQQHPSYNVYHPMPLHFQAGKVMESRTQFMQSSSASEQIPPANQRPRQEHNTGGMLNRAHDFSLTGAVFIDNNAPNFTLNMADNNFMASLLQDTIIGAILNTSNPNMPLRCHPGTRLEIINCPSPQRSPKITSV